MALRGTSSKVEPLFPRQSARPADLFDLRPGRDEALEERLPEPTHPRRHRSALALFFSRLFLMLLLVTVGAAGYFAGEHRLADRVVALAALATGNEQTAAAPALPAAAAVPQPQAEARAASPVATERAAPAPDRQVPDPAVLAMWIRHTVLALHQANLTGNYSILREIASPEFQAANSTARLSDAFAELRRQSVPLDRVAVSGPSLYRQPAFDERGLLWTVGFFPVGDQMIDFEMAFQLVGSTWRPFAIGVQPRAATAEEIAAMNLPAFSPSSAGVVPDAATLVVLIRSTVAALNQANLTGNYSVLRDWGAPSFQEANSPASLADTFADLRSRGIDLSATTVIDPRLFRPAEINANGMLRLTGYFPSQPEQVNFDLAFQYVGAWKLFGIGVNTSVQVSSAPERPPATPGQATTPSASPASDQPETAGLQTPAGLPPLPALRPERHNRRRRTARQRRIPAAAVAVEG